MQQCDWSLYAASAHADFLQAKFHGGECLLRSFLLAHTQHAQPLDHAAAGVADANVAKHYLARDFAVTPWIEISGEENLVGAPGRHPGGSQCRSSLHDEMSKLNLRLVDGEAPILIKRIQ